jgi:D-glycero-alpha-D-manno-heptose 1-phosphate guanylyltransferase
MPTLGEEVCGAVLAGGFGTRLRPVLADRPKVLAPVLGRPFLAYLLDQLVRAGVRQTALLTGYLADCVEAAFGDDFAGMRLTYSVETSPLGTAGALRHALPRLVRPVVLVLNGDSYCDLDLTAFFDQHRRSGAKCTVALTEVPDVARFGKVALAGGHRITRFEEKSAAGGRGLINAGVYLLARHLLDKIPPSGAVSLERDLFPRWAAQGRCYGFAAAGRFLDIGTPESYARAAAFLAQRRAA